MILWGLLLSPPWILLCGLPSGSFHLAKNIGHVVEFYCQNVAFRQLFRVSRRFSELERSSSSYVVPIHCIGIILTMILAFFMIFQVVSNIG